MARGRKPKPAHLRLIDGTFRADRHGNAAEAEKRVAETMSAFGPLIRPKGLKGEALSAWKKFIEPARWLDGSREPAAIAFCELWAEFRFSPTSFPSAKHSQLRGYFADLGISDDCRRGNTPAAPADEFFGRD